MRILLISLLSVSFWTPFALAQDRQPIIDMHMHGTSVSDFGGPFTVCTNEQNVSFPGLDPRDAMTIDRAQKCDEPLMSSLTDEALISETVAMMERFNIYGVMAGSEKELATWFAASPKRIIPAIDWDALDDPSPKNFRKAILEGKTKVAHEVGPQYDGKLVTDKSMDKYFAIAEELDLPVGIHIGEGPTGGPHQPFSRTYRASLSSALQLEELLIKYPKLRVYVEHYGSPLVEDTIALLYSHPQVYVDISQNNWGFPRKHFYRQLEMLIDAGFESRIMFGSDQMIWPETIRIAIETIEQAPFLSEEQKRDIFYNNAARFLRLSDEVIAAHHAH